MQRLHNPKIASIKLNPIINPPMLMGDRISRVKGTPFEAGPPKFGNFFVSAWSIIIRVMASREQRFRGFLDAFLGPQGFSKTCPCPLSVFSAADQTLKSITALPRSLSLHDLPRGLFYCDFG